MEELILENKNLIYAVAKYFDKYNKDDLFQAGCIGMIMAYKNYNPNCGVKFTTYAYTYILGEMKKLVRGEKGLKVNRKMQMINLKIEKAKIYLTQKLMHEPTIKELSLYLEIPEEMICDAINSNMPIYSMDAPLGIDGKEVTLQDTIANIDEMNIDDLMMLRDEISLLSPLEKQIIEKRYINDMTQQQTAADLGMSQVQVSRNEKKLLLKLKDKLSA